MKLETLKTIESALNAAIAELRAALKDFSSISWRE